MLDEYTSAFSRYLRTGSIGALSGFCAEGADLSCLQVYRNGFLRACIDALRASYPSVEHIVGEERFPALARLYVETCPPHTASLVEYGEGFPRFIEEDTRKTHCLDYLASFAALDRAWSEVHFSEDADLAAAAARTAPAGSDAQSLMNLRGRLSPWVRMVSLEYRALQTWSRLRQGEIEQRTEVQHVPQQVLIWRSGTEVLYRDLSRPEHVFLAGVAAGRPCGEAAGAALDIDPEFNLVATFASLLHHRMLTFEH